nr:MAG TPA: hypothetical protein [Caudoviricetes sp.]
MKPIKSANCWKPVIYEPDEVSQQLLKRRNLTHTSGSLYIAL